MQKLTYEYVKNYVEIESNSGCKLMSDEYTSCDTIMVFLCNCGTTFTKSYIHFKKSPRCNECGKLNSANKRRKTHDNFIQELNLKQPTIECLDIYNGANSKLKFRCKIDGFEFYSIPANLLFSGRNGNGCEVCHRRIIGEIKRKNNKTFLEELKIINPNVELLEEYYSQLHKIKTLCKRCGHIWEATPTDLLGNYRCPNCKRNKLKDTESFVSELRVLKPNIKLKGEYIRANRKVEFECLSCGNEWFTTPNAILRHKHGCACCHGNKKKTDDQFVKELLLINKDITTTSSYKSRHSKIDCQCKKCLHTWNTSPGALLRGTGCPKCNISKGESLVAKVLDKEKIGYKTQKTFKGCYSQQRLKFDFYIANINLCIEYQGKQHYEPVDFGGKGVKHAQKEFDKLQQRDNIKRQYCKDNNISLLEIPYWLTDEEVEEYILKKIRSLESTLKQVI